jgi:ubiquinone/menaquinone biosynthesis C-methylase UbiE
MPPLDAVYAHLWAAHGDEFAVLDRSLQPRSWAFLYDVAARAGLSAEFLIFDAGCGRGNHAFELSTRFGCRAVGLDVVLPPLQEAMHAETHTDRVGFVQGNLERIPLKSEIVDFVWCRDMLVHVMDLESALRECARVLQPERSMLIFSTLATGRMEPREAERLYHALSIVPRNMSRQYLEESFTRAGFRIVFKEEMGAELIEFYEERDGRASRELMRLARMRRRQQELMAEWGRTRYEVVEALYHWVVYQLLGKLSSAVYLLEKISV